MSKSVVAAYDAYPLTKKNMCNLETNARRVGFQQGYEQCQKDFMEKACKFLEDRIGIEQKIEVNENGEPLADSYIAYCVARKAEADKVIQLFCRYMEYEKGEKK